jgi:formimidoylglutamate deiminase
MIWTAERIIYQGRARREMGLDIAVNGRIRRIAPLSELPPVHQRLDGQAIVLGRVNPYHHSLGLLHRMSLGRLARAAPVGWADGDCVWDTYAHLLTPADMYVVARAAFLAAVMQGITALGEVYSLRYTPAGQLYPDGQGMAEAIVRAAQDVGLRVGLIDNVRLRHPAADVAPQPKCQAAPDLEAALEGFDALVNSILTRHDPRLSWALGAHSLDSVSYENLVAMRVRLGHMPFFLPQPASASAQARAHRRYGQDPLVALAERDVLDACMSIVTTTKMPRACLAAVAQAGPTICLSHPPHSPLVETPFRLMQRAVPPITPCVATGSADVRAFDAAFADWPTAAAQTLHVQSAPRRRLAASFEQTQRVAAAALGVDAGNWAPGRWGDFVSVTLPERFCQKPSASSAAAHEDDEAVWAADSIMQALSTTGIEQVVREVIVGGVPVVHNGYHPFKAESDAAMAGLVRRLLQNN